MHSKLAWAAAAMAIAATLLVAIATGRFWNALGAADISPIGWLAMGFGIVVTLALGVGLMALMFFSSRHGYDERGDYGNRPPVPESRPVDSDKVRGERQRRQR
jgi:hypothetical protein